MKISELKKIIRQNIIQELDTNENLSEYDFLYEKEEEEDIEITSDEEPSTEEPTADTSSDNSNSNEYGIQDPAFLEKLKKFTSSVDGYLDLLRFLATTAEKDMNDGKLTRQIENTITYLTRQQNQDVKEGMGPKKMNELDMESLNRMDELVNQNNLRMLITAARGIIKDLEEFKPDDISDFIVNKIKKLKMPTPGPVRENYDLYRMKRLAGLIK